jgi:hypothetical protein
MSRHFRTTKVAFAHRKPYERRRCQGSAGAWQDFLVLKITDAGKESLLRCNALVHAAEARLMDGLDPADDQVIRRWLVSVAVPGGS